MSLSLREKRDRVSIAFLLLLFTLLPLTVVFGHRGIAPWLLLAALPAFARGDFWQSAFGQLFDAPDIRRPFFACFVAILLFCFWIFLSAFWSPRHQFSLIFYVLGPVFVGGSVVWFSSRLPPLWAHRLSVGFVLSLAAGAGVLFFEGLTGGFLRGLVPPEGMSDQISLGRGVTAIAPALFPAAAITAMLAGRPAGYALIALGFAAALANGIDANVSSMLIGVIFGILALLKPRQIVTFVGILIIFITLTVPLYVFLPVDSILQNFGEIVPPSWLHRIAVWQSVAARVLEGLPFGFGAEFARAWSQSTPPMIAIPGVSVPISLMPTHPHNVFLQIWLELGLPGVMFLTAAIFFGLHALRDAGLPRATMVGVAGAAGCILSSFLVEGSLWQVWRLAAIALAAMGAALARSFYNIRVHRAR